MSNLIKLDFTVLEVFGRNYLKWVQDVKLHLTAKSPRATIEVEMDIVVDKVTAMIFIQRHMHDVLQTEYLTKEDPQALWVAWRIVSITKETYSCLKQDTIGSICTSKSLSP